MGAELISSSSTIKLALFGCFAAVAWLLLEWWSSRKPRLDKRLEESRDPSGGRLGLFGERKVAGNRFSQAMGKAAPALSAPLTPKNDAEVSKTRAKLSMAGFRSEVAPQAYWALKTLGLLAGFVLGGGSFTIARGFTGDTLTYAGIAAGVMFYLPEIILWLLIRSRQANIFYSLPDALDLMVVCVEAGLGLDQAMRKVADEMKRAYRVISEEFALCNFQLQVGRARNDVLHDLGARTGVDDLKSLAAIIIQADKFGSSVAQALRVQSDSMRTRRRQMAEEKAAKTAVKLIFPLVIFIFPAIFVVLVGPAAITMVNEMFPAMSGGK